MAGSEDFDLSGSKAMVVGAEHPAGGAIALAYAAAGADVALCALTPDEAVMRARRVKREIEALGRQATEYVMDVTLGRNVQVTMRQIAKELGGLDVVASAPDLFVSAPLGKTSDTELQRVMQTNFNAQFFVVRSAAEEFRRQQQPGRIVLVTSALGERGLANVTAYASAHGAVHSLVRAAAQELAPDGIRVNGIALGWMDWMEDRLEPGEGDGDAGGTARSSAVPRRGEASEVGPLAVYLSSEQATRYVTGQVFAVDGGLLAGL